MEEINRTAGKLLGIRKKDWMITWKQPQRKQLLDRQTISRSKIPRLEHLENSNVHEPGHILNMENSGHLKDIRASKLDESLQTKAVQGSKDHSSVVRSLTIDLDGMTPAVEMVLDQFSSSPEPSPVEISSLDQQQTNIEFVETVLGQANNKATDRSPVSEQRLSPPRPFQKQLRVKESDSSLSSSSPSRFFTNTTSFDTIHPRELKGRAASSVTNRILLSLERSSVSTMDQSNQNQLQAGPESAADDDTNPTNLDNTSQNNSSRATEGASQSAAEEHTSDANNSPEIAASTATTQHGANVSLPNTTIQPSPLSREVRLAPAGQPASSHQPLSQGNASTSNAIPARQSAELPAVPIQHSVLRPRLVPRSRRPQNVNTMPSAPSMNQNSITYSGGFQPGSPLPSPLVLPEIPPNASWDLTKLRNQQAMAFFSRPDDFNVNHPSHFSNPDLSMRPEHLQGRLKLISASNEYFQKYLTLWKRLSPAAFQFDTASNNIPPSRQFLLLNGPPADNMWRAIASRLKHRPDDVNQLLNKFLFGTLTLQSPYDLTVVCDYRDRNYLAALQVYAIWNMPIAMNLRLTPSIQRGIDSLIAIFNGLDPDCWLWFVNLPFEYPVREEALPPLIQMTTNTFQSIATNVDILSNICYTHGRLPLMSEVDTLFDGSIGLTTLLIRCVLIHWTLPPWDDCCFNIIRCYATGLRKKKDIELNSSSNSHRHEIDMTRQSIDAEIKTLCEGHRMHAVPASNNLISTRVRLSETPRQQSHGSVIIEPTPSFPGLHVQDRTMYYPTRPTSRVSAPQPRLRQRLIPPQLARPDTENPGRIQFHQSLAFPMANRSLHSSEYGVPLHHAHLREPITMQMSTSIRDNSYRAYVSDFVITPLKFTHQDIGKAQRFRVEVEMFAKLPRGNFGPFGGPLTRTIDANSRVVRLRGAACLPKTVSEWYTAETHWPWSIAILLNGRNIEFRRKPQYSKDLAVDVTSIIQQGDNRIQVSFLFRNPPPASFRYTVALELVESVDINALKAQIQPSKPSSTEEQLKSYFEKASGDEIEMILDHLDISLVDPFTSRMPNKPARSIFCKHFQCFDLDTFLESRSRDINQPDQFVCPICGKDARPGFLEVDGWMEQVLQKLKGDNQLGAKVIRVLPDLTWTVKEEIQGKKTGEGTDVGAAASTDASKVVEIIELD